MNLGALSSIANQATSLSNLVLATPQLTNGYQPQNISTGLTGLLNSLLQATAPALLFHYEGENTVSLESDITDHFIEDNTAIQDQIALRPEMVTVHGFIGELNTVPQSFLSIAQDITDKLVQLPAYIPGLSASQVGQFNQRASLYASGNKLQTAAVSAWSSLSGQAGASVINGTSIAPAVNQNKQQTAFQQFYGYWRSRYLFTVQTPWAVFQNMAIYKLRSIQNEETRMMTDFEVTFKLIRMASTQTSALNSIASGRLDAQQTPLTNNGTSTPQAVTSPTQAAAIAKVK